MGLCLSKNNSSSSALNTVETAAAGASSMGASVTIEVPEFTLREIQKFTGNFSPSNVIGKGRKSGMVYRASLPSGRPAAAKRLRLLPASAIANLKQQIAVASTLRHENVVRLLGYTITGDLGVLIYELAAMGTLHDILHGPRGEALQERAPGAGSSSSPAVSLSWDQRVRIALDTARGLAYMHEEARPPGTHGDVRSTNVLMFDGFRAKISDYNMYRVAQDRVLLHRAVLGTMPCLAPETVMTGFVTVKSDVFTFGGIVLELLTRRLPLNGGRRLVDWAPPLLREGRIEECIDPKLGDHYSPAGALKLGRIAVRCVEPNPTLRPSMGTFAQEINNDVLGA